MRRRTRTQRRMKLSCENDLLSKIRNPQTCVYIEQVVVKSYFNKLKLMKKNTESTGKLLQKKSFRTKVVSPSLYIFIKVVLCVSNGKDSDATTICIKVLAAGDKVHDDQHLVGLPNLLGDGADAADHQRSPQRPSSQILQVYFTFGVFASFEGTCLTGPNI